MLDSRVNPTEEFGGSYRADGEEEDREHKDSVVRDDRVENIEDRDDVIEENIRHAMIAANTSGLSCLYDVVKDVVVAYDDARHASKAPDEKLTSQDEAGAASQAMSLFIEAEKYMGELRKYYRDEKKKEKVSMIKFPQEKTEEVGMFQFFDEEGVAASRENKLKKAKYVLAAIDNVYDTTRKGRHGTYPMIQQDLRCSGFFSLLTMFLTTFSGSLGTYILIPGRFGDQDTALQVLKAEIAAAIAGCQLAVFTLALLWFVFPCSKCGRKNRGSICCTFKVYDEFEKWWKQFEDIIKIFVSVATICAYTSLMYLAGNDFPCVVAVVSAAGALIAIIPTTSRYKTSENKIWPDFMSPSSPFKKPSDSSAPSNDADHGDADHGDAHGATKNELIFYYEY